MGRSRKLKELENKEIANALLSEQYTLDDLLDPKAHWEMMNMSEKQKEEYMRLKRIKLFCLNLSPCIVVAKEGLNGLDTYKNAENIGLTKDMNDEQKSMLQDLSNDVDWRRALFISRKRASVLLILTVVINFVSNCFFHNFYDKIHPAEDWVFWGLVGWIISLWVVDKKIDKNIAKQIYFIAKEYEK